MKLPPKFSLQQHQGWNRQLPVAVQAALSSRLGMWLVRRLLARTHAAAGGTVAGGHAPLKASCCSGHDAVTGEHAMADTTARHPSIVLELSATMPASLPA